MKKFITEIKKSKFKKYLNKNIIIISLLLAIICTLISYPGFLYTDSYTRIENAQKLLEINKPETIISWLTTIPSFSIALSLKLVGNISLYTLTKAFLFFLFSNLLINNLSTRLKKVQLFLILINPLFYCVSVYYETGVGIIPAMIGLLLLLNTKYSTLNKFDKIIYLILIFIFSFIMIGYRTNSISILPIIFIFILKRFPNLKSKINLITIILLAFIATSITPKFFNIKNLSNWNGGLIWDIVSVIDNVQKSHPKKYDTYLDDIYGKGSTKTVISINNYPTTDSVNDWIWTSPINITNIGQTKTTTILAKYFNLLSKEPKKFIEVKLNYFIQALGITKPLKLVEWDYNRLDQMAIYKFNDSKARKQFYNKYIYAYQTIPLIKRPYLLILMTILVIELSNNFIKDKNITLKRLIYLVAIFYYIPFLINSQSIEFRYFYPSCYLLFIILQITIIDNIYIFIKKERKRRSSKKYL